jgi:hypothetical protein
MQPEAADRPNRLGARLCGLRFRVAPPALAGHMGWAVRCMSHVVAVSAAALLHVATDQAPSHGGCVVRCVLRRLCVACHEYMLLAV